MLLQIAPQLPPIKITVQQAPGMSEWAKTLLSAGIGALFGILSGLAVEYVKPLIGKLHMRRTVLTQLAAELTENLNAVLTALKIIDATKNGTVEEQQKGVAYAMLSVRDLETDRYNFYVAGEKTLVYEIDEKKVLASFYLIVKAVSRRVERVDLYESIKISLALAAVAGRKFFEQHKMPFVETESPLEDFYRSQKML